MFDTGVLKSAVECNTLGWRNKCLFLKQLSATYLYVDVRCWLSCSILNAVMNSVNW